MAVRQVVGVFLVLAGLFFGAASFLPAEPVWPLGGLGVLLAAYGLYMVARAYRYQVPASGRAGEM